MPALDYDWRSLRLYTFPIISIVESLTADVVSIGKLSYKLCTEVLRMRECDGAVAFSSIGLTISRFRLTSIALSKVPGRG